MLSFNLAAMISLVMIVFAVVKSASFASTTSLVTISLSETIPTSLFAESTMGTAPILRSFKAKAISLIGVSG